MICLQKLNVNYADRNKNKLQIVYRTATQSYRNAIRSHIVDSAYIDAAKTQTIFTLIFTILRLLMIVDDGLFCCCCYSSFTLFVFVFTPWSVYLSYAPCDSRTHMIILMFIMVLHWQYLHRRINTICTTIFVPLSWWHIKHLTRLRQVWGRCKQTYCMVQVAVLHFIFVLVKEDGRKERRQNVVDGVVGTPVGAVCSGMSCRETSGIIDRRYTLIL